MRLHSLKISGFRRLQDVELQLGDATFLIGENNSGKSAVLRALEILLSGQDSLGDADFYSICKEVTVDGKVTKETECAIDAVTLEAEFRDIPIESTAWRGFKGRVFTYGLAEGSNETGYRVFFRKVYRRAGKVEYALKSQKRTRRGEFADVSKPSDLIEAGIDETLVKEIFPDVDKKIGKTQEAGLELIDDIWDVDTGQEEWFVNAGGIIGNILVRLPRYLLIPAEDKTSELTKGTLAKTMGELFEEVRDSSENYRKAQEFLNLLAKELDPSDDASEFGKMMTELNEILDSVFPDSQILTRANLSDPNKVLQPVFEVEMSSNIRTPVTHQGTGAVRAAVFALLRYRKRWEERKEQQQGRGLIIGFEEPELYLHPNAANQMRDTIYDLATGTSQIVCTTHSPYMIDLARKPRQVLNAFSIQGAGVATRPFSVSDEFLALSDDDRTYVKMILRMDDHIARVFFARNVVIVEGDTEDIIIRESLRRFPSAVSKYAKAHVQIVKARGKASIIPLVKYLRAMGIELFVVHDRDGGVPAAEVFNAPILAAVGTQDKIEVLQECVEDAVGYPAPDREKPFTAYKATLGWGDRWEDVPEKWRKTMERAWSDSFVRGMPR